MSYFVRQVLTGFPSLVLMSVLSILINSSKTKKSLSYQSKEIIFHLEFLHAYKQFTFYWSQKEKKKALHTTNEKTSSSFSLIFNLFKFLRIWLDLPLTLNTFTTTYHRQLMIFTELWENITQETDIMYSCCLLWL